MAGVCELVAVLSRGQWLVCELVAILSGDQWLACELVAVLSGGPCVSCYYSLRRPMVWLLFCQDANGWCV